MDDLQAMDRRQDSDDDRPPLPSVPPPPLSPSNTPPPTPVTPSPLRSDSPALGRKESKEALRHPEVPTTKVCPTTGQSITRPRSKDGPLSFSREPILDIVQYKNPPGQTEEQSNSSEFNLDLDNFSRELMNVFEDLDAKIIAHQKASDGLCFALLPKSLRTKTSSVAGDQNMIKKIVDSQNYIVTSGSSSGQHRNSYVEIGDDSSGLKEAEDPGSISNGNPADCDVKFSVKERAVPSPARKFEDELAPQKFISPSLNRSSSFSNSIVRKSEKLPGTIFNQSYHQDHHHQDQDHHYHNHHQHEQSHKRSESFDGSNISYMLYSSNRIDDNQNSNKNSKINNNNNNFNKYKSASLNNDSRNGPKANPSPEISTQNAQTPKQQKSGFHSFCSRLKQRSAPNRSVYRQYVRQVIDTAPKLDGYDSDVGGNDHNNHSNFYGSLCSSPVTSPESTRQPKLSDGAPVNIFGTVRKHPQEARGIGHAFRNIRNLFSSTTGKQDETRLANCASQKELIDTEGTPIKTAGHSFRGVENRPQTGRNHVETSYFPFNDSTLRRRTSFQSLLNVFNKPAELHQSTWKSRIDNGNLACDMPLEPRGDPYPTRSTRDREGNNSWKGADGGGYGNLTSSKRFVSCLEIRLGK